MANNQSTYAIIGKFTGLSQITSSFGSIAQASARASRQMEQDAQRAQRSYKTMTSTVDAVSHGFNRVIGTGREIGSIWRHQAEGLRVYVEEALRLAKAQEKFRVLNLGESENQRAFAAVRQTVDSIKGLSLADVTEQIVDVHSAVGDLNHAIEMLPQAAKFRFGFETLLGDKFSPEQIEEQLQNAMKVLESMGKFAKGKDAAEHSFNVIAQMMAGTSGRVKPSELLQFVRRGNPAVSGLSDQGLRNMTAVIQELSGAGAGVAVQSLYQALVGGVMKQSSAAEFQRLGLLDPRKIQFGHGQKIKKLLPGANKLGNLMLDDPLTAADALVKAMAAKGVNTSKDSEIRKELTVLFQNRNAQRLMNILTTQRGQVTKESGLAAGAMNIEQMYNHALDTPMGKMKQFENNLKNLEAEIGGPLLQALTDVASAAMPIMKLIAAHPQIALWTIGLLKFTSAIAQTGAALRMSGIAGWVKSLFAGPAVTAAGAAAGMGAGLAFAGAAGLAIGVIAMTIQGILENIENDRRAAEAGDRIGQYLRERFTKQIEGKSSAAVQKELDKAIAPALAKDIIEAQGLDTAGHDLFGPRHSAFLNQLESITTIYQQTTPEKAQAMTKEQRYDIMSQLRSQTGIVSAEQLDAYLKQAQQALIVKGQPEIYPVLERLARDAFPQFEAELDKIRGIGPAAEDVATALRRLQSAANQPWPSPSTGPFAPPMPKLYPKKGEFNFGGLYPSRAMGGDVLGKGFVEVHPGERINPARVTRGLRDLPTHLLNNINSRVAAATSMPNIEQHFHTTVTGNASPAEVKAAVRAAAAEGRDELMREVERYLNERHKDIAMGF